MTTTEQKLNKWKTLPGIIKNILADGKTDLIIQEVGRKANLHIDQIGELSDEVALTLLGFTPREKFLENIKNRLQIDDQLAGQITKDLDEKIFAPIQTELQKILKTPPENPKPKTVPNNNPPIPNKIDLKDINAITSTDNQIPLPNYTSESGSNNFQKENWQEIENRNVLMKEIENPPVSPFKIKKSNDSQDQTGIPQNIPSATNIQNQEKSSLFKPPIIRTMESDMEHPNDTETIYTRENELQTNPSVTNEETNEDKKIKVDLSQTETPKINQVQQDLPTIKQNQTLLRGKFGRGNIPIPKPPINKTQTEIPKPDMMADSSNDMVSNSEPNEFNQKIKIPSVKKTYVVDPYREPLE